MVLPTPHLHLFFTPLFLLLLQLSARSATPPEFSELSSVAGASDRARKSRQPPKGINCSDCKQKLTQRIRQMQHLERMKHRIMTAIRNNGNYVPTTPEAARDSLPPKGPWGRGSESLIRTPRDGDGDSDDDDGDSGGDGGDGVVAEGSDGGGGDLVAAGDRKGPRNQKRRKGKQSGGKDPAKANDSGRNDGGSPDALPPAPRVAGEHPRAASIQTKGRNIVSFSRILLSGKRKHILQFTLKPMPHGRNLEVVKAHLWLLLTRHQPQENDDKPQQPELSQQKAGNETPRGGKKNATAKGRPRGDRRNIELDSKVQDEKPVNSSGVQNATGKGNREDRQKRSPSSSSISINETSPIRNSRQENPQAKVRAINKKDDQEDPQAKVRAINKKDDQENPQAKVRAINKKDDQEDGDEERYQAVLRVLLLADNGTRTLMTYLRTNVRMTHWQKVRLPVSLIQQQLRSSQNTLTLLIRCRRCGDAVRIVLPKQKRSKSRRKERRRRRRKNREKKKAEREKNKRHPHPHRRRKRRHGVRGRKRGRRKNSGRKHQKKEFRPLPFLVINTRLRSNSR